MSAEKDYLARNVHENWQIKDLDTDEWLTVQSTLHMGAGQRRVSCFTFTDGTTATVNGSGRVLARRPSDEC
jgi:hypothetical protein